MPLPTPHPYPSSARQSHSAEAPTGSTSIPTDTIPFTWSCKCLNVIVDGHIPKDLQERIDQPQASGSDVKGKHPEVLTNVWVESEQTKQPDYVIYEGPGETRGREWMPSGERDGTWRRCLLCDAKVYRVTGLHYRDHPPAKETWVEVELEGSILYGIALSHLKTRPSLPFSDLYLPLKSTTSNFGRPSVPKPPARPDKIWVNPSAYIPRDDLRRSKGLGLIPVEDDCFFLPPPFLPKHPHLEKLCKDAVSYLGERHRELEAEVLLYMQKKTDEMRELDDRVRSEVEMLWDIYRETNPETKSTLERRRGSKVEDPRSRSREPPQRKFSPSPVVLNSSKHNVRPRGTGDDQLAQANLSTRQEDGQPSFAVGSLLTTALSTNAHRAPAPPAEAPLRSPTELANTYLEEYGRLDKKKDGRAVAMSHVFSELDSAMEKLSTEEKKARQKAMYDEEDAQRRASMIAEETSREATPVGSMSSAAMVGEPSTVQDRHDEDEVFDFELGDGKEKPTGSTRTLTRGDDGLQFAAHAPSHRAGWKKSEKTGKFPWYENKNILDRASPSNSVNDDSKVSSLATSMPVHIARQPLRSIAFTELEKKTSLSEREGKLVPPLRVAMKKSSERLGNSSRMPRGGEDVQPGVTRQEGFVPPHVQIREEEKAKAKAAGASMSVYDKY